MVRGVAHAQPAELSVAAALSLTGPGSFYGMPVLEGARLAVEEANAAQRSGPHFALDIEDDHSSTDESYTLAKRLCGSDAVAVIGPALTITSLTAGPAYAQCGMPTVPATAHGDDVPSAATTFQPVFNGGEMGASLAAYLKNVLHGGRAMVPYRTDGYGTPFARGFQRAADQLGIETTLLPFATVAERDAAVKTVLDDRSHPAVALGMINNDAVPILVGLRRGGFTSPILAPSAIGGEDFVTQFANEPEEQALKGFFTEGVYAASPILFDSANAEVLDFVRRFRARYNHEPSWPAVQGYDSARLLIDALLSAASAQPRANASDLRAAAVRHLVALSADSPLRGVTGPIWFNAKRQREQPVRVGLFHDGLFDSAPIQLVPVRNPSKEELKTGEVFEALPGRFVRRQRVVYTGVFVNEVPRIDLQRSTFNLDFYLWLRVAENAGPIAFDPTDIRFVGMSASNFNRATPSESRTLPDGTVYRLWRIDGEIRNEFDLRRFPFDEQDLKLVFYNARADADHVVYVLDRSSLPGGAQQTLGMPQSGGAIATAHAAAPAAAGSVVSENAFHELTQWTPRWASERRENLVTTSPLGAQPTPGATRGRELSGYVVSVDLKRKALSTASKNLLPLVILTAVMFASLYFPHGLVKEKVTVAITAALSGAVLLTSINTQLGNPGYTIAAEYVFYVFFCLSLLCVISVLMAERMRVAHKAARVAFIEQSTRIAFVAVVLLVVAGFGYYASI